MGALGTTSGPRRRTRMVFYFAATSLLVGALLVGNLLYRQAHQLQRSVAITEEIVNANVRSLGQVQRELLRLQVLVESASTDTDALALQAAFVSQRMNEATLSYQRQTLGTDELLAEARSLAAAWETQTAPIVERLVAAPTRLEPAERAQLSEQITALELGFNRLASDGEVNRKAQAGRANDASSTLLSSARRLLIGLVITWSGFLAFLMIGWFFYLRLARQRREASKHLAALDAEARKLSLVASRTDNLVIITDGQGLVEWTNDAFTRITGYTLDDVKGLRPGSKLQGPDTDPATVEYMREKIHRGEPFRCEVLNYTSAGVSYWVDLDVQPVTGPNGEIVNYIAVQADVTERHRLEEHLRRAKDAAEQFAEEKTNFLASMSHEIRTPLNSVLGFTELLLGTDLTETQREYAATARDSGAILLDGLNNILNFSALESGRVELDMQHFDVRALLRTAVATVTPDAVRRGLNLRVDVDPGLLPIVHGDPTRLRQIVVNLLSNAIKFTEVGEVVLSVRTIAADNGEHQLHVAVADTGIGIAPDRLDRLFRPFTQGDASITRRFGGTGLGLAISQHLAMMLGGEIAVESTPGVGTTFRLSLPVQAGDAACVQLQADQHDATTAKRFGPLSVLLVEDDPVNQRVATHMLARLGCKPQIVANGAEAVAALRSLHFDLVLMDLHMPVMDGITATGQIRALRPPLHQPMIVGLTASALVGDRERVLRAGMDGYLSKPVQLSDLAAALDAAAQRLATHRDAASRLTSHLDPPTGPRAAVVRPTAVDEAEFARRMGDADNAHELLVELVPTFLEDAEIILDRLAQALDAADLDGVLELAHRLKGTGSAIAATTLAAHAAALETEARSGDTERARLTVHSLRSEIEQVGSWLDHVRATTLSTTTR